jgi:hypothetical protein
MRLTADWFGILLLLGMRHQSMLHIQLHHAPLHALEGRFPGQAGRSLLGAAEGGAPLQCQRGQDVVRLHVHALPVPNPCTGCAGNRLVHKQGGKGAWVQGLSEQSHGCAPGVAEYMAPGQPLLLQCCHQRLRQLDHLQLQPRGWFVIAMAREVYSVAGAAAEKGLGHRQIHHAIEAGCMQKQHIRATSTKTMEHEWQVLHGARASMRGMGYERSTRSGGVHCSMH